MNAPFIAAPPDTQCYHCGDDAAGSTITVADKYFCCQGCKTVYEILEANDLCTFYQLEEQAGSSLKGEKAQRERYAFLDNPEIVQRLIEFTDGQQTKVRLKVPQMHCASCIWLLENLSKLHKGVLSCKVNFMRKEVTLHYLNEAASLHELAALLSSIGYAPDIKLESLDQKKETALVGKGFYFQLGVAGFAFGNIMLLSFPEYLGLDKTYYGNFHRFFGYLNIFLALPVLLYSARDYLRSAWAGLRQKQLNMDVPISLGILALFGRSTYEILAGVGSGYMDSMAGLIFFLLVGKWFQQRTYRSISFDRDYKSYFPISAEKLKAKGSESTLVTDLVEGDRILVRNQELIPADALLIKGHARIDYSFVTGEAEPVRIQQGELIYAGGRQVGEAIELSLVKSVSQSHLTQLWNDAAFEKEEKPQVSYWADKIGQYFTLAVLLIATGAALFWLSEGVGMAFNIFTAVLIVACPCALALSVPFTLGNTLRVLGKERLFVKNTAVLERMAQLSHIIFDKTGTLTDTQHLEVSYQGPGLNEQQQEQIRSLAQQSSHPLSKAVYKHLSSKNPKALLKLQNFEELTGAGLKAQIAGQQIWLGSAHFLNAPEDTKQQSSRVYLRIDEEQLGYFELRAPMRKGLEAVFSNLKNKFQLALLSGDQAHEQARFAPVVDDMHFEQSPEDKLRYIAQLQEQGGTVMMMGDGLNDAGALRQSDVGIALADEANNFSPACDAILEASRFDRLALYLNYSRRSVGLLRWTFVLSILYNSIGLGFAVTGNLAPIIAAILMPISSITVIVFGTLSTELLWRWMAKKQSRAQKS